MAKKRVKPPKLIEKQVYQEAGSACSFCRGEEVASLQIHHIDEDPSCNELENLLLVCANCHSKITAGQISEADVRVKKRELQWRPKVPQAGISVSIVDSTFKGDIAQNITKIVTPKKPRVAHPEGSIGADLERRAYVTYLIGRYFDFRKADPSYGRRTPFSHAEIHKTIQRTFGYQTFFTPVKIFPDLVEYLKDRIDRTITGKRNTSRGVPNYHSFEDHNRGRKE